MLPDISIVLCTYSRYESIKRVVSSLQKYIVYPRDRLHLVVADDCSPDDYVTRLKRLKIFQPDPKNWASVSWCVTSENSGWGHNVNSALYTVKTEYTFFIEDDYELKKTLDLQVGVSLLMNLPHVGMLRYRGTAGTHLVYHQFEANISQQQPRYRQGQGALVGGKITYLQVDGNSPSLYIYSNGPHLKRNNFHKYYGMYPEGLALGTTEQAYAHTIKDLMRADPDNAPGIAILPEWVAMHFDHVGESHQHGPKDKGERHGNIKY